MPAPFLDDDGGVLEAVEDFAIDAFVAQFAVEGFTIVIFLGLPGSMYRVMAASFASQLRSIWPSSRAVIETDVFRIAAPHHYVGHRLDDPETVGAAGNSDRQAFPG